jgi:hypothetical protein
MTIMTSLNLPPLIINSQALNDHSVGAARIVCVRIMTCSFFVQEVHLQFSLQKLLKISQVLSGICGNLYFNDNWEK